MRRMLGHGFLAANDFNPTLAHQPRYVEAYMSAADVIFAEVAETIERGDVRKRINGKEKHTMFGRLTEGGIQ